jgi:hypothetical protein
MMMINEKHNNVLIGGVDEVTNISYDILKRFGLFKNEQTSNFKLFEKNNEKTIPGEGSSYFLLAGVKGANSYASITDMATFYKPKSEAEINSLVADLLSRHALTPQDVDMVLLGKNGDVNIDASYDHFVDQNFPSASTGVYKHLCGEYETASSFALWAAAKMLKKSKIPAAIFHKGNSELKPKRILVYNQYFGHHHSLILLESC